MLLYDNDGNVHFRDFCAYRFCVVEVLVVFGGGSSSSGNKIEAFLLVLSFSLVCSFSYKSKRDSCSSVVQWQ